MRLFLATIFVLLAAAPSRAGEWFAAECTQFYRHGLDRGFQNATSFEKAIAEAAPGSTLFVPRPFPTSDEAIVEDLRWWYERTWADTSERDLPDNERLLHKVLSSRQERYEIHRVANWTPQRCNEIRRRDYFFLVRVFDASGLEIARFPINRYGLVTGYSAVAEDMDPEHLARWRASMPSLQEVQTRLNRDAGAVGTDPQYVWALGPRAQCRREVPCIALRSSEAVFLYSPQAGGTLLRFSSQSRRVDAGERDRLFRAKPQELSPQEAGLVEELISLSDEWVQVETVPLGSHTAKQK